VNGHHPLIAHRLVCHTARVYRQSLDRAVTAIGSAAWSTTACCARWNGSWTSRSCGCPPRP